MFRDKRAAPVSLRELLSGIKRKLQRRYMRAEQHIRNNRARYQLRLLRLHAWVHVAPDGAVAPARQDFAILWRTAAHSCRPDRRWSRPPGADLPRCQYLNRSQQQQRDASHLRKKPVISYHARPTANPADVPSPQAASRFWDRSENAPARSCFPRKRSLRETRFRTAASCP